MWPLFLKKSLMENFIFYAVILPASVAIGSSLKFPLISHQNSQNQLL